MSPPEWEQRRILLHMKVLATESAKSADELLIYKITELQKKRPDLFPEECELFNITIAAVYIIEEMSKALQQSITLLEEAWEKDNG